MTELLTADGLTCMAEGKTIVDGASLRLEAGESIALLGPSGSGKTMLLTALAGLVPPISGRVSFMGEPLHPESGARRQMASVLQTYGLFPLLTASENVEIALRAVGGRPEKSRALSQETLENLGLGRFAQQLTRELSGGQEQRVAVARALAIRPKVLLADEPTTEQDQIHRDLVLDRLLEVTATSAAVLIATHDDEVAARCDRIIEIHDGRLTPRFDRDLR